MSQVVHSPIQVPDYIRRLFNPEVNKALSEGIGLPMRVVSARGKVFRLIERGIETIVTGPDGRPSPVFDCVIIRANPTLSRNFYLGNYKEGDDNPPDCWSLDNIKPDETVKAKQHPVCATCPQNAWGSKQSDNGSRAKACSEQRRLAVVPIWELDQLDDPSKTPYLLRVPPGSLQALKIFGEMIERAGLPYNAISTRIAFDVNAVFQMTFEPVDFVPEK